MNAHARVGPGARPARLAAPTGLLRAAGWALLIVVLGAVIGALPPLVGVAGLVSVALVALALPRPALALGALLLVIPFSSLASLEVGDFDLSVTEPLVALLAVAWLLAAVRARQLRLEGGLLLAALVAVLAAQLLSFPVARSVGLATKEVVKWAELLVAFAATTTHVRREGEVRWLLAALFLAGSAEALVGVYQFFSGEGPEWFAIGPFMRAYGTFEQPNPFAGYLGTILPVALAMALAAGPLRFRLLAGLAVGLLAVAMLMSLSRGAWVGTAVALALVALVASPRARRALALAGVGVVLLAVLAQLGLLPAQITERVGSIAESFGIFDARQVEVTDENFAVVERMAHWQAAWDMFRDHPWLGVGPGNYPARYAEYELPGWPEPLGHAHNYYLNVAAELGLFGLLAFLATLAAAFARLAVRLRAGPVGARTGAGADRAMSPGFERALLLGLLGGLLVLSLHNLFDSLFVHGVGIQVGFYLGLVAGPSRGDER